MTTDELIAELRETQFSDGDDAIFQAAADALASLQKERDIARQIANVNSDERDRLQKRVYELEREQDIKNELEKAEVSALRSENEALLAKLENMKNQYLRYCNIDSAIDETRRKS